MIKVHNYNFGYYNQKLIMIEKKIKDVECTCKYGLVNKDMWKNPSKRPCKHIKSAILRREIEMHNDNIQKVNA